ncbi:MAG: hypothetical protein JW889_16565 [Verrucomicrobia bacterium]|nr:hypothetical protein [Verrucomicrobiota bacterium]
MCGKNEGCTRPDKKTNKAGKCSPEQIKECHGDVEGHPCGPVKRKDDQHGCCGASGSGCCQ